jgi:hypothetical protein
MAVKLLAVELSHGAVDAPLSFEADRLLRDPLLRQL